MTTRDLSLTPPVEYDTFEEDLKELSQSALTENDQDKFSTVELEADDDILERVHEVGVAPNADLENPDELHVAQDINQAEQYQKQK